MKKEIVEVRRIIADEGFVFATLDRSAVFGTDLCLGCNDSEDNYIEIPAEEAAQIQAELDEKARLDMEQNGFVEEAIVEEVE